MNDEDKKVKEDGGEGEVKEGNGKADLTLGLSKLCLELSFLSRVVKNLQYLEGDHLEEDTLGLSYLLCDMGGEAHNLLELSEG